MVACIWKKPYGTLKKDKEGVDGWVGGGDYV
jgi:hypothetical protein